MGQGGPAVNYNNYVLGNMAMRLKSYMLSAVGVCLVNLNELLNGLLNGFPNVLLLVILNELLNGVGGHGAAKPSTLGTSVDRSLRPWHP